MPLTREFKETTKARANRDAAFRAALLTEAVQLLMDGKLDAGKRVFRNYINATVGFEGLSSRVGIPTKSLMRMFSAKGNPKAANLFSVISHLQAATRVRLVAQSMPPDENPARHPRAAAIALNRVEALVMSKDMEQTFHDFDEAGMTHEERRAALHAKYGQK